MYEILMRYNVKYHDDKIEILNPVLNTDNHPAESATHDFNILKEKNLNFVVTSADINNKILKNLLEGNKVYVSNDINYHYLNADNIEIDFIENIDNIKNMCCGILSRTLDQETYISYISSKINMDWPEDSYVRLDDQLYKAMTELYDSAPHVYFKLFKSGSDVELVMDDVQLIQFYIQNNKLYKDSKSFSYYTPEDVYSNDRVYLTEESYYALNHLVMEKLLLQVSKELYEDLKFINLKELISKILYKISTEDNPFDDTTRFHPVRDIENIQEKEVETILGIFKTDPGVLKYQKYKLDKLAKNVIDMSLYISNLHKTQFLSLEYFNLGSVYNLKNMNSDMIINGVFDETGEFKKFKTNADLELYGNIDSRFLKIEFENNYAIVSINEEKNFPIYKNACEVIPYNIGKPYGILKPAQEILNLELEYDLSKTVYVDVPIMKYLKELYAKNLIPVIPYDNKILCNIGINNIIVLSQDLCELENRKRIFSEELKQKLLLKSHNITLKELVYFVETIQEFSLYGIFIKLSEDIDFDDIKLKISEFNMPEYKKQYIKDKLKIIEDNYMKYIESYQFYKDEYIETLIDVEKIENIDSLNKMINEDFK